MIVRPRKAGPKAIRRWVRDALELSVRNLGAWLLLVLSLTVMAYCGSFSELLMVYVGFCTTAFCSITAVLVDDTSPKSLQDLVKELARGAATVVANSTYLLIAYLIWTFQLHLSHLPEVLKDLANPNQLPLTGFSTPGNVERFGFFLPLSFGVMVSAVSWIIPLMPSLYGFLLRFFFGTGYWRGYLLDQRAVLENSSAIFGMIGLLFAGSIAVIALQPVLIVPFSCLAGSLIYVSFREIFLGIGTNATIKVSAVRMSFAMARA